MKQNYFLKNTPFHYFFLFFFLFFSKFSAQTNGCAVGNNNGFEYPVMTQPFIQYYTTELQPDWRCVSLATNTLTQIEMWKSGFENVTAYEGNQFVELNAHEPSVLIKTFQLGGGLPLKIKFAHRGRWGTDVMSVKIGLAGNPLATYVNLGNFTATNSAWVLNTVNYNPSSSGTYEIRFEPVSSTGGNLSVGNFLDGISFERVLVGNIQKSNDITCSQPTAILNASSSFTGAGLTSQSWSVVSGAGVITPTADPRVISVNAPGVYKFEVVVDGCTASNTVEVFDFNDAPVITGQDNYCIEQLSAQFSGSGVPATTNAWVSSDPNVATISQSGLLTFVAAGVVTITYTNQYGCTATKLISISDYTATPVFSNLPSSFCQGATIPPLPTTSSNGISGTWSPAINPNVGVTSYTFTPTLGQCAKSIRHNITITPNVTPVFSGIVSSYCQGASIPALPTTSDNGISGTWSPAINNQATTTYTFTPINSACATATTQTITITPNVIPVFSGIVNSYCQGATILPLPTTSSNGISGTWSPAINNQSTTTYTFTPLTGQCAIPVNLTITITPNVTPVFSGIVNSYCQGATIPALPTTSTNGISGTWSPVINNQATTTYTFTPSTSGGCTLPTTLTITITPNATPVFSGIVSSYCQGASIPALPTTSTNGISGTWSPAINNQATTTYTFTPINSACATATTQTITITPNVTPVFSGIVSSYCQGASIPALPTTSNNGISGTWSPAINNQSTTTYTFTPLAGQCGTTATQTITITPNVTPVFSGIVTSYCQGATIPALPTTSTNGISGTWSSAINNQATTTYTFTPNTSGGCTLPTTLTITITPNVTPVFSGIVSSYCQGASIPALPTTSTNGISGTWSPTINNQATITYTFTPLAGQCGTTATQTITITPNVTPVFSGIVTSYCQGATIPALPTTSTNGISGTWSPAINNQATTTYTFTPSGTICANISTLTITITPSTLPVFTNIVSNYCQGAIIPALPTTSTNGISGTWSPAINNQVSTTYTFTPNMPGGCYTTTTHTITIKPKIVSALGNIKVCNQSTVVLDAGPGYQYLWSNGATTQTITVSQSGVYSVQISNGTCQETFTSEVNFLSSPVILSVDYNVNTLTVTANQTGIEYSIDGGANWSISNVFSPVNKNTLYTILVRNPEVDCYGQYDFFTLQMPNAFTPNGDGKNDEFDFSIFRNLGDFSVSVYDKYNKKVFAGGNKNPKWNGKYANYELPTDTYWYNLSYIDKKTKKTIIRNGWILLKNRADD